MRSVRAFIASFALACILLFGLITPVFAACNPGETETDLGCIPNDVGGFVSKFYGIGLGLIGGVGVLFIIIGGYYVLTSQGNPARLAIGKSYIAYAVIGVLLAIFGFVFVQVLTVDILRIPGFN